MALSLLSGILSNTVIRAKAGSLLFVWISWPSVVQSKLALNFQDSANHDGINCRSCWIVYPMSIQDIQNRSAKKLSNSRSETAASHPRSKAAGIAFKHKTACGHPTLKKGECALGRTPSVIRIQKSSSLVA